ncbi:MFS transporter [Desmospora profundinema]|uniref:MFS family permease n=1 Tax=Desmospora profundinema TaxID=1571184 RepID=A0ABU1ILZ4_9BACL|nr:MFS transporter [Desmospora profundinema]MDR6225174.1 MFS family permease [Desmospora profundinema]
MGASQTNVQLQPSVQSRPRSLWHNRDFLFLWTGSILSNFGFQIYLIALPLLIYDMTQSALAMSTMRAIDFFPNIFIGMIAGVIVDRYHRKWVMSMTTLVRIITLGGIIYLLYVEHIELWHLYILGFILSAAGYTFGNSHHSVLPQIISKQQLTAANAKLSFVDTLINMIGPGIAGFLIAIYSYQVSFTVFLVCLCLVFLFVQLTHIPAPDTRSKQGQTSLWMEMKEGIDALWVNKMLLTPTIVVLFINLASSLVIGVLIFYAADWLHASEKQIGLMYSMGAVGGLLGSLCIPVLRKRYGRGQIYVWCLFLEGISYVVLVLSQTWWMVGISLLIRVFSITMSNIVYFTIRQELTPNHLLGRVAGTSSMLMKLALPLGLFLSGIWAEFLPIKLLFVTSMSMVFLMFLFLRRHPFAAFQ